MDCFPLRTSLDDVVKIGISRRSLFNSINSLWNNLHETIQQWRPRTMKGIRNEIASSKPCDDEKQADYHIAERRCD